jgi:hypothetical protein
MARIQIPDALGMRRLKYDPAATDAERDATATALRAAGRIPEAILLYEGRAEHPALAADQKEAIRLGSSFVLRALERIGVKIEAEAWRACAAHAEMKERWYDALRCHEILKDEVALARVREKLPNFKIAVPENKK